MPEPSIFAAEPDRESPDADWYCGYSLWTAGFRDV
jgi:hypothetical protein